MRIFKACQPKPYGKGRRLGRNRRKLTLIQKAVLAGCFCAFGMVAAGMIGVSVKSVEAETSGVLMDPNIPLDMVPMNLNPEKPDVGLPVELAQCSSPIKEMRIVSDWEPASSHSDSRPAKKEAGVTVVQKKSKPLPTPVTVAVTAEEKQPEPGIVHAQAVSQPVRKVETSKPSPIPSFENTAYADSPREETKVAGTKSEEPPLWKTLVSVMFRLVFVIILAYVSMLGLKWFMANKDRPLARSSSLRVLETVSLGANRAVHVVQCQNKKLILASTPNQVSLISEADEEVEPVVTKSFDGCLQETIAQQKDVDTAAMKVGQALRNGALNLYKMASQHKPSVNGNKDEHA